MIEHEVSYTFTYPQDVLYSIKALFDQRLQVVDEYVEIIDENGYRTRMNDKMCVIKKEIVDVERIVVLCEDSFVPMIKRRCVETIYDCGVEIIERLVHTKVYGDPTLYDNMEIKFEHLYFEHNKGDVLDPLVANKLIKLYNLLTEDQPLNVTSNSHLGTDEILANCRVEIEFGDCVNMHILQKVASFIKQIELNLQIEIEPFLPHTMMMNEISFRPFAEEKLVSECKNEDVYMWASKIDGVRGKACLVNGSVFYIQLDDMQQFSGKISRRLDKLKNLICGMQVEYVNETFYVTDVLCVYKYKYNNKNQFDVSTMYEVDLLDAANYLNNYDNCNYQFGNYEVKFQKYYRDPKLLIAINPNDGFIGIDHNGYLIKIKHRKTYEMLYTQKGLFKCLSGEYRCLSGVYNHGSVYEVIITEPDTVEVLKIRPDRFIAN
jgi:hypothetical protein